jgi:hypothetical protein
LLVAKIPIAPQSHGVFGFALNLVNVIFVVVDKLLVEVLSWGLGLRWRGRCDLWCGGQAS